MNGFPPSPANSGGARRSSQGSLIIPDDDILITNVGVGKRSEAFHWLMLGHNVYDSEYQELTVRDLEHNVDPHGVMNPMYVRGSLWKTVAQQLWLAQRGGKNGPEPAQPGLDPKTSAGYYGHSSVEVPQRKEPQISQSTRESHRMAPHVRSENLGSWPARPSRNILLKSKSMTSLSDDSLKSPGLCRRASFTSTDSASTSHCTFESSGEARIVWTTKEPMPTGQHRNEIEGFVYELVLRKRSRARLDSLFDAYSISSEGEVN